MDQQFIQHWRSDPISVVVYSLTLVITYSLIARAIAKNDLGFGYILLPWIVEYLLMLWIGVLLTRTWVKEPIFAAISGSVGIAMGWTVALLAPYAIVLGWQALFGLDPETGSVSAAWQSLVDSGMVWACVAVAAALLVDTVRDVSAWRASGGPFVWPATHRFGFRLAGLLAVWFATPFLFGIYLFLFWLLHAVGFVAQTSDQASSDFQLNWIVFIMLLAADALVLVVGTWMHRRDLRNGQLAENNEAET